MMNDTLCRHPMRSLAAFSMPAFHDQSIVRIMTKAINAMAAPATVKIVRNQLRFRFLAAMRKRESISRHSFGQR